jgi:type II secretory pathway component PulM
MKSKTTGPGRRKKYIFLIFGLIIVLVLIFSTLIFHPLFFHQSNVPLKKSVAKSKASALEQQIDIQAANMITTTPTYTDASGSGFFLWNSARYSSLQHVYFEAGMAKSGTVSTTQRIRGSILNCVEKRSLVS